MTWTRARVLDAVMEIVKPQIQTGAELTEKSHLVADLGVDSLGVMEIVSDLEDRFGLAVPDDALREVVRTFAIHRRVTTPATAAQQGPLETLLLAWAASGEFGAAAPRNESCMIHVDFKRRYGGARAICLR